jgi:hypothetical protein
MARLRAEGGFCPRYHIRGGRKPGAGCCALAASGHAVAAPPRRVMNLRRFMTGLPI